MITSRRVGAAIWVGHGGGVGYAAMSLYLGMWKIRFIRLGRRRLGRLARQESVIEGKKPVRTRFKIAREAVSFCFGLQKTLTVRHREWFNKFYSFMRTILFIFFIFYNIPPNPDPNRRHRHPSYPSYHPVARALSKTTTLYKYIYLYYIHIICTYIIIYWTRMCVYIYYVLYIKQLAYPINPCHSRPPTWNYNIVFKYLHALCNRIKHITMRSLYLTKPLCV